MSNERVATVFEDDEGEWRWHVKAGNGEIVAQGESYTRKEDAHRGLHDANIQYDEVREELNEQHQEELKTPSEKAIE